MGDFIDNIKNAFSSNPHSDIPSTAWEDFQAYTKERDRVESRSGFPWLVPTLLGFLLFTNIFWWNYSENRINSVLTETITQVDTIYITKVITEELHNGIDQATVTNTDYFARPVKPLIIRIPSMSFGHSFNLDKISSTSFISQSFGITDQRNKSLLESDQSDNDAKHSIGLNPLIKSFELLYTKDFLTNQFQTSRSAPKIPIYIKNKDYSDKSFLEKIRPKSLSIYAESGFVLSPDWQLGRFYGISHAVGLSTSFSRSFRFLFGAAYQNLTINSNEYLDQTIITPLPEPENSSFLDVSVRSRNLMLNSQIEYNLHTIGRIRPFLGIGLTYGTSTLNNIEYRFEGPDGRIEVYLPDLDPQSFWLAGINIGCDINLLERLDLRANFNSRLRLRGFKHKGLYSFNTGFNYHL